MKAPLARPATRAKIKIPVVAVVGLDARCTERFANRYNALLHAIGTILLGIITFGLILSAVDQQKTTRAQLRAYLSINPSFVENYGAKEIMTVNCHVENSGQTPAFDVGYKFTSVILPEVLPAGFEFTPPQREILPTTTSFPDVKFLVWFNHESVMTEEEFNQMRDGNLSTVCLGCHDLQRCISQAKRNPIQFFDWRGRFRENHAQSEGRRKRRHCLTGYVFIHGPRRDYAT